MNRFQGQNITTVDLANLLQELLDSKKTTVNIGIEDITITNSNNVSSTVRLNLKPGRSTSVGLR